MKKIIVIIIFSVFLSGCLKAPPKPDITDSEPSPKPTSPIEEITKDWQQFENEAYAYLVKYPQEWHFHPNAINPPPPRAIFLSDVEVGQTKDSYASFTILTDEANGRNLTNYPEITESIDAGFVNSDLEISGSKAVLLVGINQNQFKASVYVLRNNLFYRLSWQGTDKIAYQRNIDIFKQILASFKFTN